MAFHVEHYKPKNLFPFLYKDGNMQDWSYKFMLERK